MEGEYYKTKKSVTEYIKLAADVSGKELIEKLKTVLKPNSDLLEIGSGPGTDWRILNKTYKVVGSDNSVEFLDHLISQNPNGEFLELDASTLKTEKVFDGVYSNKVMHHLTDIELANSIKRQHEILNPNGIICHSFWEGESSEVFKGLFVNYHNEVALEKFYGNHFEILSIEPYAEFEDGDSLLLIARKKGDIHTALTTLTMIRKHTEDDLEQLLTIWSLSSTKAHPFLKPEFVEKVSSDMRNLYMPNSETWVYEEEEEIVGFVSMMENEIGGLFVLPNNMGNGIGRQLVDFVSKSHEVLEVEVFEKNKIGRAFYDKYGFQNIKEFVHEESDEPVIRMRKQSNSV